MNTQADLLARAFLRTLRSAIGAKKLATAIAWNKAAGYPASVCYTHEYCDANEAMLVAFESCFDREADLHSDADSALIDAAWRRATKPEPGCEIVLGGDE